MPVQAKAREGQAVVVVPTFSSVGTNDATLGMCGLRGSIGPCRRDGPKAKTISQKRKPKVKEKIAPWKMLH